MVEVVLVVDDDEEDMCVEVMLPVDEEVEED